MKHLTSALLCCVGVCTSLAASAQGLWHQAAGKPAVSSHAPLPASYKVFTANAAQLRSTLGGSATAVQKSAAATIEIPMPDGSLRTFTFRENHLLPPALKARYPQIATYNAIATDDATVTAMLDMTEQGFHALVFDGSNTALVDPADGQPDTYIAHYRRDEVRPEEMRMNCDTKGRVPAATARKTTAATTNGNVLRSYRLALSCDHQYAHTATGDSNATKAAVLGRMATTMNRVNGVYERELSVSMTFVDHEDTLIFNNAATDPFGSSNDLPATLLTLNQQYCDSLIGNANYDIGHIFSTGAGGLSQVAVVCSLGMKAQSATGSSNPTGDGFDIDYVAHEMGHEFGANHPFNNDVSGSCALNAVQETAYEPGSGSTIMAYAGICSPDNIQPHSDAYFHSVSLQEIERFLSASGDACASKSPTGNKPVQIDRFTMGYAIPYLTPFEITAPTAVDSVADTLTTYCWEQWNLGDFMQTLSATQYYGPIFRSYPPGKSPTRVFPHLSMLLSGQVSDAGNDNAEGEKLPDVARQLNFKLTVRDIYQGNGSFLVPNDSILISTLNIGYPHGFRVTSQNTDGITLRGGNVLGVNWDVVNTDKPPIYADSVNIFLSVDGGNSWPYPLGTFANNGATYVTLPNPDTTTTRARLKVKGAGNIFFNVNLKDFAIIHNNEYDTSIILYPVPAHNMLYIYLSNMPGQDATVYDMSGRQVWSGYISKQASLPVDTWARGMYIMRMTGSNGHTIRKFVLR